MDSKFQVQDSFVLIKQEPSSSVLDVFCRCCFKSLHSSEVQHSSTEHLLKAFQDITQVLLESHQLAMSFCDECFNSIHNYHEFKALAILKQQKLNEMMKHNLWDLSAIQGIKSTSDPLLSPPKEELEQEIVVKVEIMAEPCGMDVTESSCSESPPASPKVKQKRKKTVCRICRRKVSNVKSHTLRFHGMKCDWCSFKSLDKAKLDHHVRSKHMKIKHNMPKRELNDRIP